jgi:hypothetical protein
MLDPQGTSAISEEERLRRFGEELDALRRRTLDEVGAEASSSDMESRTRPIRGVGR